MENEFKLCDGCRCTKCKGLGQIDDGFDYWGCQACHGSGARVDELNFSAQKKEDYMRVLVLENKNLKEELKRANEVIDQYHTLIKQIILDTRDK